MRVTASLSYFFFQVSIMLQMRIVPKIITWIVFIVILSTVRTNTNGERWSRQTSNSEWIPLADPRNSQKSQSEISISGVTPTDNDEPAGQLSVLSLPSTLQQQYQNQLLQLQKTQESIQRLLLLQQQLKAQQQLLQSQAYQPNGFVNTDKEKQALHQSSIINLQTLPVLAPEVLIPPHPSSKVLPPVFQSQDFHSSDSAFKLAQGQQNQRTVISLPLSSEQVHRQSHEELISHGNNQKNSGENSHAKQNSPYEGLQRYKEQPLHINFVTPTTNSAQDSSVKQEEIQLVYVPAETLAQRGQVKLHKSQSRKHYSARHNKNQKEISSTSLPTHDTYAREILHQLQREHEEKNQFLSAERQKEIARLHAEQKELERQARIYQDIFRKEQEFMRQREVEKKRKELSKIEEISRQRELYRLQEIREKELQDEKNLAELKKKEKEEKQRELKRLTSFDNKKEISKDEAYEQNGDHKTRTRTETKNSQKIPDIQSQIYDVKPLQTQSLVRESQLHHQHLTEVTNKNLKESRSRFKPRNKLHRSHQQELYHQTESTPLPNQPPLSVYMGKNKPNHHIQIIDVLKTLKNARTLAVLDSFESDIPSIFVGPRNLDPPSGYAKFDLPYLSSIENNRVERKVDTLPFFVAPLSFDPPAGYSKILFPAPHIGSVVINSLENIESKLKDNKNLDSIPLIEPNSYLVNNQPILARNTNTPAPYSQDSTVSKFEVPSLPPSNLSNKWTLYENKPSTEFPSIETTVSYNEERTINKFENPSKNRNYYSLDEVSTTPRYSGPKTVTAFSFEQTVSQSTPLYHEESTRNSYSDSSFINRNIAHHQRVEKTYHDPEQQQEKNEKYIVDPTGHILRNKYLINSSPNYEDEMRYNLPAELPAISPQLPGLVNALVEKSEVQNTIQLPSTQITTTVTTVPETLTTYRSRTRHRSKGTAVKTTITATPDIKDNTERVRRPMMRSRSKYTTTTEEYADSSYDPTKRNQFTISNYDDEDSHVKSTIISSQKYKVRENKTREFIHTQITDLNTQTEPDQYGNVYKNLDSALIDSSDVNFQPDGNQNMNLNISLLKSDNYSTSTTVPIKTFSHHDFEFSDSKLPLSGLEYTRKSTHVPYYQTSTPYKQAEKEEQPVNEFKYRPHEISSSSQNIRELSYYRPGKMESVVFESSVTTDLPNIQKSQLQDYSPVYHSISFHDQYDQHETPNAIYHKSVNSKYREQSPIFLPISENKQEEFTYQTTISEIPFETTGAHTIITTTTTTTEAPLIIRQRIRSRLSGRSGHHVDSTIQAQSHGSQDEYVRFNAVNQDSTKTKLRQRVRPRARTQQIHSTQRRNSPVRTDGQEYVRIQTTSIQQRKPPSSAISQPKNSTEERIKEEEYGFTRSPNYNITQQINYKAMEEQVTESFDSSDGIPVSESNQLQAQILKNRQKHYSATRRPISSRITTTTRDEDVTYTIRSPIRGDRTEEVKSTKVRTRLRRPGIKKRMMTTTENILVANNELPLDENYSRIVSQRSRNTVLNMQRNSYDDKNSMVNDQNQSGTDAPKQDDLVDDNYPQEFLLNYGAANTYYRENYDQAQLIGDLARHHFTSSSPLLHPRSATIRSSSDIYGAESQWSSKLSDNSFQPSSYSSNQTVNNSNKFFGIVGKEKAEDILEIVTVGPDTSSITVFVTATDDESEQKQDSISHSEESITNSTSNTMIDFGKKMNTQEQIHNVSTIPIMAVPTKTTLKADINNSTNGIFKKVGLRRRRVRVRVRPAGSGSEEFATAESQSYNSSLNNLSQEMNKFRNFDAAGESTTVLQALTTISTTTESVETEKSIFNTLLDKTLDKKEIVSTNASNFIISTAKISSDGSWINSSTIIPEAVINEGERMTLKDKSSSITNPPFSSKYFTTASIREDNKDNTEFLTTSRMIMNTPDRYPLIGINQVISSTKMEKSEQIKNNSGNNVIQLLNSENSFRYFVTKSPAFSEYLRSQEKSKNFEVSEDNYPKNHRSKWSEVRYPTDKTLFDFAKWNDKNQTKNKEEKYVHKKRGFNGESDSTNVTDFVKAIFESIKNADEEHHQSSKLENKTISSLKQDKEFLMPGNILNLPLEIKTSVSTSSTIVAQPQIIYNQKQDNDLKTIAKTESVTFGPFVPLMISEKAIEPIKKTPFETNLGKILRTTTTTKVSHMTEICYRGRCIMSKPKKEGLLR